MSFVTLATDVVELRVGRDAREGTDTHDGTDNLKGKGDSVLRGGEPGFGQHRDGLVRDSIRDIREHGETRAGRIVTRHRQETAAGEGG